MEIILKKDHTGLGYEGDICKVKAGFARNYLIPRNIAVGKTEANLRTLKLMQKSIEKKREKRKLEAQELKNKIVEISLVIKMKVGDNKKLYGSVTQQTILDALKKNGIDVHKKDIHLDKHIKDLGNYTVEVKLYHDVVAPVNLRVISEEPMEDIAEEKSADTEKEKKEIITEDTETAEPSQA